MLAVEQKDVESAGNQSVEHVSIELSAEAAYLRGYSDFNFFAGLVLPDVMRYSLPLFYILCWQLIVDREPETIGKLLRFALGLPRGHAKTTFIKVLIAWLICYNKANFILIVCATDGLAEAIVADISDMLGSPQMEAVYGTWYDNLITDRVDQKKALYQGRPVIMAARGAESSLRGLNIKHKRPDVILCDDMQTRENDESPTQRQKLLNWMVATLLKVISERGDRLVIYVGNMYSESCILMQLKKNKGWISFITGAILEDGTPLWPELFSLEDLQENFEHDESLNLGDLWFAEIMNDPRSLASSLIKDSIPLAPIHFDEVEPDGVFMTIDPAGFKALADDNVIVLNHVIDGKGSVAGIDAGNYDPKSLIFRALTWAIETGTSIIGVETVAYQQTLKFWFEYFIKELKIEGIEIVELNPSNRTKESRIRLFVQELYAEEYYITDPESRSKFVWQALAYKLGKKDNRDDILDACAYALDMRKDYWHLITNRLRDQVERGKIPAVRSNNTPF